MFTDVERFSTILAYIENNLFENISLEELSKKALLSEYTFHRFFTYLTGYSFSNYLRNRRLSEAGQLLRDGGFSVDEISDMCDYANRSAFHRAFSNFHGLTPSEAKQATTSICFFPPIKLDITISGGKTLNYRIEQLPSFQVVGILRDYLLDDQLFENTGKQWETFFQDTDLRIIAESDATKKNFFGINRAPYFAVANPLSSNDKLHYFTGFVLNSGDTKEYTILTIPKQTYAVFTSEPYDYKITSNVSTVYNDLQQRIFNTWLPEAKYTRLDGAEIETYVTFKDQACLEIWLPIDMK